MFFDLLPSAESNSFREAVTEDALYIAQFRSIAINDGSGTSYSYSGRTVTNAWLCDDAVKANGQNVWYLQFQLYIHFYFMDTGILGLLLMNCETAQLENLVAIELLRRYGEDKFFYFERNIEIDFYVPEEDLAIQVCYNLFGSEDTKNRELQAFVKFRSHFPDAKCLVISNSEECEITVENVTVSVVPIWKWLVERKCVASRQR